MQSHATAAWQLRIELDGAWHERAPVARQSDGGVTPPDILTALGPFALDPCAAPDPRPWDTATVHYTLPQNGLALPWTGRVFLNPPPLW